MTESPPRLVLASGSPRRSDVLRQLGLEPEVIPSRVDEGYLPGETPEGHARRLAREKAEAVAAEYPDALVVAGDTIVVDGGTVLVKPTDEEDAVAMLLRLAGGTHRVLSGIAVAAAGRVVSRLAQTQVTMRRYGEAEARAYAATGEPMDKAGGYGIQGLGAALVEEIHGDYYCVVGFPVPAFLACLHELGWEYRFGTLTRRATPAAGAR